jgi:hypothetical protein
VYWADQNAGAIRGVKKWGGLTIDFALNEQPPRIVVTDGTRLFWAGQQTTKATAKVRMLPLGQSQPVTLADDTFAYYVAVDGSSLYWGELMSNGAVRSCQFDACSPGSIATSVDDVEALAIRDGTIYFAARGRDGLAPAILACPEAGCTGTPTVIGTVDASEGLAVDATHVYWADAGIGVKRCPRAGCGADAPETIAKGFVQHVRLDGATIYFDLGGVVAKCPLVANCTPTLVTPEVASGWFVTDFAVDDSDVYYALMKSPSGPAEIRKAKK